MGEKFTYKDYSGRTENLNSELCEIGPYTDSTGAGGEFFRELFNNMPGGCAVYNVKNNGLRGSDYIIKNLNNVSLKIEGKTLPEVIGIALSELSPDAESDGLVSVLRRVWETGTPEIFSAKKINDKGSVKYYENYIFKLPAGEVVTICNDVTDKKMGEAALMRSESFHRTLVNTIPDLVWLKDINGVYISCNSIFEIFFGAKEAEISGKTDYDFKEKELADFFRENDRKAMEADGPSINEEWLTFAGNGYHGLFETIKTPMRDADGTLIGILGIARDISQREKAERDLKDNEERYKMAQRIGKVGNWEYDIKNKKFWGSEEAKRIYGFDPDSNDFNVDVVEHCIIDKDRVHQALVDLIEKGQPYDLEFAIKPVTGAGMKVIRSNAELVKDDSGRPVKVLGVIQDITSHKKAEEERIGLEKQLRQSQKLESVGLLAGGIAHDFNNILAAVIGYTEMALDEAEKGSRLENDLHEVLTAGTRAKSLVNQIMAFARKSEEDISPVRVSKIAEEALRLLRSTIPSTIEIRQELDSDSAVMGNPAQIHQIFMNLCTNAAHSMEEESGILTVKTWDISLDGNAVSENKKINPGRYIMITVSDTGCGIDPDIIDSIFDPYFTTKGPEKGSGMGLSVVHGIAESLGGFVDVSSENRKGAVFTVYLPVTGEGMDLPVEEAKVSPNGSERILFIDDELSITKIGEEVLRKLGYSVTARTSSVEALELFKVKYNEFDLIVTDLTMPNLSGDKLAIQMLRIRPDIPIIVCTGYSKKLSRDLIEDIGVKAIAYKPLERGDLARIIRKVLNGSEG